MEKKNYLVIGLIVLIAAISLAASFLAKPAQKADENTVVISVDGKEYARIPLSEPQTVTVSQQDGCVNVVEVSERGALMLSSTCHNQLCVQMGEVTVDNWAYRPNQQFIICLPNRVSIELAVTE